MDRRIHSRILTKRTNIMEENIMGERYLITGVQLGLISELLKHNDKKGIVKLLKDVDKQFIGSSNKPVRLDANKILVSKRLVELLIILKENYPQHQEHPKSKGLCRCEACQALWLLTGNE